MSAGTTIAAGRCLGLAENYDELVRILIARRRELGLSQMETDFVAGLADGYTSKIEMSVNNPTAKNARSIGRESLPLVLGALRVRLAIVVEE